MRFSTTHQSSSAIITSRSRRHPVICAEIRDRRHHISPRHKRTAGEHATVAEMFANLKAGEDIRTGKVAEVRASLAAANYDEPSKLDIVVDRLLDELQD